MSKTAKYKLKILLIIVGCTAGVCVIFRYLLPYLMPFAIALLVAYAIDKPVSFLTNRFKIKRIIASVTLIILVFAVLGIIVWYLGRILVNQVYNFAHNFDAYLGEFDGILNKCCNGVDESFGIERGTSYCFISDGLLKGLSDMSDSFFTRIMSSSMSVVGWFTMFFTTLTITIMASVFLSRDMGKMRENISKSVFSEELGFIITRLKNVLGVYLRTQVIIMAITATICTVGLYFLKNSYALLLGVLIGIIDAFPILGTGTVFMPWTIILLVLGRYKRAAGIFVIYLICYYSRQFLEPKLMGHGTGMPPILMLISVYVGLLLFGILGVITGPIAALLIKEISAQLIKKLAD